MRDFKHKRTIAIIGLVVFVGMLYGGFRYWQYTTAYGRVKSFTGTVTRSLDKSACKYFEVDKKTLVKVSCGKGLGIAPFTGQYDQSIKIGDHIEVKATRYDPNGSTIYKMYETRDTGTFVKKL